MLFLKANLLNKNYWKCKYFYFCSQLFIKYKSLHIKTKAYDINWHNKIYFYSSVCIFQFVIGQDIY